MLKSDRGHHSGIWYGMDLSDDLNVLVGTQQASPKNPPTVPRECFLCCKKPVTEKEVPASDKEEENVFRSCKWCRRVFYCSEARKFSHVE